MSGGKTPWWTGADQMRLKKASEVEFKRFILYVTYLDEDVGSQKIMAVLRSNMVLNNETYIQDVLTIPEEERPSWLRAVPVLFDTYTNDGYRGSAIIEFIKEDYEPTEIPQYGSRIRKSARFNFSGSGMSSPYALVHLAFKDGAHETPEIRALARRAQATEDDRERARLHARMRGLVDAMGEQQRAYAQSGGRDTSVFRGRGSSSTSSSSRAAAGGSRRLLGGGRGGRADEDDEDDEDDEARRRRRQHRWSHGRHDIMTDDEDDDDEDDDDDDDDRRRRDRRGHDNRRGYDDRRGRERRGRGHDDDDDYDDEDDDYDDEDDEDDDDDDDDDRRRSASRRWGPGARAVRR